MMGLLLWKRDACVTVVVEVDHSFKCVWANGGEPLHVYSLFGVIVTMMFGVCRRSTQCRDTYRGAGL